MRLVISDAHEGLKAAIRKHFTGASWQRCRVHFARNLLQRVPKAHQDMVAAAFRMVFMHPDAQTVTTAWDDTAKLLTKQFPRVAELMTAAKTDVLAFAAFPPEHWRKIWSNNPLERLNKEIKRRSNVVQIFPDEPSQSSASSAPSSPSNTTNGPPAATTSPKAQWRNSTPSAKLRPSQPANSSTADPHRGPNPSNPTTTRDAIPPALHRAGSARHQE